jgi:hypothetical protein
VSTWHYIDDLCIAFGVGGLFGLSVTANISQRVIFLAMAAIAVPTYIFVRMP